MKLIVTAIIMFGFWILLSGEFSPILLISAGFSSLFVAYISHDLLIGRDSSLRSCFATGVRFLRYCPWLLWQIILSNIDLVKRTLHPSLPIDPCLVTLETSLTTDLGITILGNSITITPGTVTIDANKDGQFLVHAISREAADALVNGDMHERVYKIERGL
ncbi:MAG: hypothetical protein BMS9Abin24_212 [Thermodesulfobacteriota bacterium]|nr:MAG: hypothetical protein BMS9Abin24_212 [Thermodesulfobacteriota bacterium]